MYFPIIDVLKENFTAKIPSIVTQWLTDNVDPVGSAVVVDTSLSISGAAADAKITGDELNNLKSDLGTGFLNTIDYAGDVNSLGAGVTRVTANATNIPIAQVGYVVTVARTKETAKAQLFITAPIIGGQVGGTKSKLFARNLVAGTWSEWVEFADSADVPAPAWMNGTDYSSDLNNAPAGVARVLATAPNNPAEEIGYILTIVRAETAKAQLFITNSSLYFRLSSANVWSDWTRMTASSAESSTDRSVGYTFGDSLMAQDGKAFAYATPQYNLDEIGKICIGWQTLLSNKFGVTMTNFAVGGQGIASQKQVILSKTYTDIDFVIISIGVNDYSDSVPLGALPTSRNATFTNGRFIDDLCESIEYILSQNPTIKILLFTPCQRDTTWRNDGVPNISMGATDIYTQNNVGLYLKDYADAIREIGKMYSCVVCDMYAENGLNYLTLPEYTFEGVHPTNEGYKFTSRVLFEAFKKL